MAFVPLLRILFLLGFVVLPLQAATLYSSGDPTPEEQLYLELINRARANPSAEGQRLKNTTDSDTRAAYTFWKVNLDLMVAQFATIPPAPPLAMNARLLASARVHSQDMLTRRFQGHNGSNGSTFDGRIRAQGYTFTTAAENVFASSKSVPYGHAAFEVDWGVGVGGMQTPPGHRNNLHSPAYREIGIGNIKGTVSGGFGPQFLTQDLATSSPIIPFLTGVVYRDANSNGFYDMGEGVGGVRVDVAGSAYYAVTPVSGGYAIPMTGSGIFTATFSGGGVPTKQQSFTIASLANVKVDYLPTGSPAATPELRLSRPVKVPNNKAQFEVTLVSGTAAAIEIHSSAAIPFNWARDTTVVISPISAG